MTKATSQPSPSKPAVVLYCANEGKARAAVFKGPDVDPALKAAQLLNFSVFRTESEAARKLCRDIPLGRIGAKGENIAPFVRKELFDRLKDLAERENGSSVSTGGQSKNGSSAEPEIPNGMQPRLPLDWADIKVGDLVLAQDKDPSFGWWEAIVAEINGDLIKLRWPDEPRGRPVQRHRLALGLMFAGDLAKPLAPAAVASGNGPSSVYPNNWAEIGLGKIVLAKEDGPMQQWWEAKVEALEGEVFTLGWLDHQSLPQIKRPRLGLALVHPNPKGR